jgi:signal transduction histidine kinase
MTARDGTGALNPTDRDGDESLAGPAAPPRWTAELAECARELAAARQAAHELNNRLVLVTGYGELLAERLAGSEHAPMVQRMVDAADAAGGMLHKLQELIRFEQCRLAGLDLPGADVSPSTDRPG